MPVPATATHDAVRHVAAHRAAVGARAESNQVTRTNDARVGEQLMPDFPQPAVIARQIRDEHLELVEHFGLAHHRRIKAADHFEQVRVGGFAVQ